MDPDIRNPHTTQDIDKLEATIATLRHEAYAYKRQRDKLAEALRRLVSTFRDEQELPIGQAHEHTRD